MESAVRSEVEFVCVVASAHRWHEEMSCYEPIRRRRKYFSAGDYTILDRLVPGKPIPLLRRVPAHEINIDMRRRGVSTWRVTPRIMKLNVLPSDINK